MSKSSKNLFNLKEFNNLHYKQNLSINQIAEKFDTYPNKVRRLALALGGKIRNKSDAQKIALQTGRKKHPTQGKTRSEEVKTKISESVYEAWDNLSEKEKKRRSAISKANWDKKSAKEKELFFTKASQAIRETAKNGSKLELCLHKWLIEEGYEVAFHKEHLISNEKMHLDIFIRNLGVAIEVDGPGHFQPIWGQDQLKQNQRSDQKKDGILMNQKMYIIRVRQKKSLTKKLIRDIQTELSAILLLIKEEQPKTRKFVIGD